ncbi:MAG: PilN domain-containing protein [Patescibacteria group bacterium]|nr:PilN domain-containing protein [Patescibacteria group bacterium]
MSKTTDIKINLTPRDPFFKTTTGKFLNWAIKVGRYIVIFTELIIIVSFAARFSLDRRVTDLNDSIHQKEVIAQSYGDLEADFRLAQKKIDQYEQVEQRNNIVKIFPKLQEIVPENLVLENLEITRTGITLEAIAATNNALNFFINNLQVSPYFFDVEVKKIEAESKKTGGFTVLVEARTSMEVIETGEKIDLKTKE